MTERVALIDRGGSPLEPSSLLATRVELDAAERALLIRAARRDGRVLERDGLVLYGYGEMASITLPGGLAEKDAAHRAEELLAAIPNTGVATIAFGALPFVPTRPARLLLPALSLRAENGALEVLSLHRRGEDDAARALLQKAATRGDSPAPPQRFELAAIESHEHFRARVENALAAIGGGEFDKVVLAREVAVRADQPFSPEHLLARLRQLHPSCCTFSIDGIVGASPELLCRREGARITSQPLAGTIGRSGDPEEDRRLEASLLSSDKERAEHAFVVEAIRAGLAPYVRDLQVPERPHLLELRNVVHLASTLSATLRAGGAGCLELVAALHPTPAVAGSPREAALQYLARTEGLDRDRYAGPVGYLNGEGDGEFWLGIRSAMLSGDSARLLAGVGIVAGSEAESELAETQLKLQALLAAAVRP